MSHLSARMVLAATLLSAATPASATNLLVVIADDLGADKVPDFADYGTVTPVFEPVTPTIADLGSVGVRFQDTWATPLCSPTRASLLTGDFPYQHGIGWPIEDTTTGLADADETLADVLSAEGYATGLFGKWHLGEYDIDGERNPLGHGFDTFDGYLGGAPEDYYAWEFVSTTLGTTATSNEHADTVVVQAALDWIGLQSEPWFAVVAFAMPHADGAGTMGEYELDDLPSGCAIDACVGLGDCGDSDADGTDDAQDLTYQAMVQCMDGNLYALLNGLTYPTLRDTLIVFMGDNGTLRGVEEAPFDGSVSALTAAPTYGKSSAFQSGVRVPLVVTDGRNLFQTWHHHGLAENLIADPGRDVGQPVLVEDLFETLLEMLDLTADTTQGQSFAECLTSSTTDCAATSLAGRALYTEAFESDTGGLVQADAAFRSGDDKMVLEYDAGGNCMYPSVYDLGTDPYEAGDVYGTVALSVRATLKTGVRALAPSWMPYTGSGNIRWCR